MNVFYAGGDYGPYTQSERLDIYTKAVNDLLSGGFAYPCFCTEKRLALLRKESARNRVPNRYDGHCRNLSDSEIQQKIDEGRPYVVRFVLEKDQNIEFEVEFVKEWVANSYGNAGCWVFKRGIQN